MKTVIALSVTAFLLAFSVNAQERTAAGAIETQMTWSALSAKIGQVDSKIGGVKSLVDQSIVCGQKGMVYAPGGTGIDGQGCKEAAVPASVMNLINTANAKINTSISCNQGNQLYNGTSCTAIPAPAKARLVCRVVGNEGPGPSYVSQAACAADEIVTGGGFTTEFGGTGPCGGKHNGFPHNSTPYGNGWVVDGYQANVKGEACTSAYAVCCKIQ